MKIEAEMPKGNVDKKTVTPADKNGAFRVILATPEEVADPKRVTMGGGAVTFRSKG